MFKNIKNNLELLFLIAELLSSFFNSRVEFVRKEANVITHNLTKVVISYSFPNVFPSILYIQ